MTLTLEVVAILVSLVALIVTVLGFFASLRFYQDGVSLQQSANDALTAIAEKTSAIQAQVGGMFDKTLDAAIGKQKVLASSFEELECQLKKVKNDIIREMVDELGELGQDQRARIQNTVDEQINLLRTKIESTKQSAADVAKGEFGPGPTRAHLMLLEILAAGDAPMTVSEITQQLKRAAPGMVGQPSRRLNDLKLEGLISSTGTGRHATIHITERGKRVLEHYSDEDRCIAGS
jgi:hypothetical protein